MLHFVLWAYPTHLRASVQCLDKLKQKFIWCFMSDEIFEKFGPDPIQLCKDWYAQAEPLEPNDPSAVTIATATKDGIPSLRWVLIKDISDSGFKFHTNVNSQKGQELLENPHIALNFYWKSTRKQIRVEGIAEQVSDAESDAYFKTRPIGRQIGAWASDQSQAFENEEDLQKSIAHYTDKFKDVDDIPRPDYWRGFRIVPQSLEFWMGNRDRLHTRFKYTKTENGLWSATWLWP